MINALSIQLIPLTTRTAFNNESVLVIGKAGMPVVCIHVFC